MIPTGSRMKTKLCEGGWVRELPRDREYWKDLYFIEGQAFLRSNDSAPRPHPPSFTVIKLNLCLSLPVFRRSSLLTGGGGGGGGAWSRIIRPQEIVKFSLCKQVSSFPSLLIIYTYSNDKALFSVVLIFFISVWSNFKGTSFIKYWIMQLHFDMVSRLSGSKTLKYEISW